MTAPKNKATIGLTEPVIVKGAKGIKEVMARIDTGAERSSVDIGLANEIGLGPVIREKKIKNSLGLRSRPIIKARIELAGKKFNFTFSLADRKHLRYRVLIGQNILRRGFIIDPLLYHTPTKIKPKKVKE